MPCEPSRRIVGVRVGGAIAEVEADLRLHLFGRAARLHVQLHDEIAAGLERPRQLRRHERRDLSRRPAEEMAVGILRRSRHQAVVAGQRIGLVQLARRGGAIDADVGVMHDARVAGMELDAASRRSAS